MKFKGILVVAIIAVVALAIALRLPKIGGMILPQAAPTA